MIILKISMVKQSKSTVAILKQEFQKSTDYTNW